MARVIVLDTSCVRGTPKSTLIALADAGFELRVSGLALDELAVYFASEPTTDEQRRRRQGLRSRLAFLRTLVDLATGIAPTHGALIDKLGGTSPFAVRGCYPSWHERMANAWSAMAGASSLEDDGFLSDIGGYVEDTGADWVLSSRLAAAVGAPADLPEKKLIHLAARIFLDGAVGTVRLPGTPSPEERFEAHGKLAGLHAARGEGSSSARHRAPTSNDATDLNLMQHLAEGLIVATRDYRLIESVDSSGSRQAPWVRSVGELLNGRAPAGPPWAFSATKAKAKHRVRERAALVAIDAVADAAAKARASGPQPARES